MEGGPTMTDGIRKLQMVVGLGGPIWGAGLRGGS